MADPSARAMAARARRPLGGYDCEFVTPPPEAIQTEYPETALRHQLSLWKGVLPRVYRANKGGQQAVSAV